jgi:hypothetical protein
VALVDPEELQTLLGLAGNDLYPEEYYAQVAEAASDTVLAYLTETEDDYETNAAVREAAMSVAVDIWQARLAPGGTFQAVDFQPGPYRLGRSTITRVSGLLGPYLAADAMVG